MTPLGEILARRIRDAGPLTVADYMAECLLHPEHGYYTRREAFGAAGDFTTAPEVSQMFGEMLGLALAQSWLDRGAPPRVRLVELGPGRGTLIADALRAMSTVPGFRDALSLHLVEASPRLREIQRGTVAAELAHHDSLEDVPEGPTFLIANEFFDALPIRQFVRDGAGWREKVVGLKDGALAFGLADPVCPPGLESRLADTRDGDIVETCPAAERIAAEIGRRLAAHGGVALVIDYGDWRSLGDTLQAVRRHERADPLVEPGLADLTAHVDFEAIAAAAAPAAHTRLTPQGVFLERLGLTERARRLAASLRGAALDDLVAAHRRLTHPGEMGTLFKTLGFFQTGSPLPPGFAN